jgi:hypothetical protein
MMLAMILAEPGPISLIAMLSLGFFLGMRHATDADHVVAVSTIVARERRVSSAAIIGMMWGAGHTITILAVGSGIILFELVIPARLGLSMEFSVGLMLIVLGLVNLKSFRGKVAELKTSRGANGHIDEGQSHVHGHVHDMAATEESFHPVGAHTHAGSGSVNFMDHRFGKWKLYQWIRPLVVGLVHGLAGSAAVALLVLTTLHDPRWAVAYLLIFGMGTIAGMMVITVAMASALHYAGSRSEWINRRLALATGLLSVAFGLFIVYQMGIVHGLFTTHPTWTPE